MNNKYKTPITLDYNVDIDSIPERYDRRQPTSKNTMLEFVNSGKAAAVIHSQTLKEALSVACALTQARKRGNIDVLIHRNCCEVYLINPSLTNK